MTNGGNVTPQHPIVISATGGKFLIGFIAGCAAVAVPRLTSLLTTGADDAGTYFTTNYILLIIVFGLFLGAITTILEYKLPRPPKETFFAALAIPGLLAGSLSTALESNKADDVIQQLGESTQQLQQLNNLEKESLDELKIIPLTQNDFQPEYQFSLIKNAYAADISIKKQQNILDFSIQREIPRFAVILGVYTDLESAKAKALEYRNHIPTVTLTQQDQRYLILSSSELLTEAQATQEAIRLKKELSVETKLLEMK